MEILKTKIEDLLQFPFTKKDWLGKFGIYAVITFLNSLFLIILIFTIVTSFFVFMGQVTTQILIFTIIFFALFFLLSFVIQLYLQGYILEIIKNTKENQEDIIPRHENITEKLKYGWNYFLVVLGPISVIFLFITATTTVLIFGIISIESATFLGIISIISATILLILFGFITIFIGTMIIPSMLYIYITKNSVKEAYCFKKVTIVIKNAWKEFLLLYAVNILASIVISVFSQLPFFGFLIVAIGGSYIIFVIAFLTGRIFNEIDKLKLFKN